jgi:uncharacterized repeat protein (TIGR03803 family)
MLSSFAAARAGRRLSVALLMALGLASMAPLQAQLTTLATFAGTSNGSVPRGGLILVGGSLYGTTFTGGANGFGTVYSVPGNGGAVTTLATFDSGAGGSSPYDRLLLSGSTLYGTNNQGGAGTWGTVFSVPLGGGAVTALGSFTGSPTGGALPISSVILSGGTLYGTTTSGGANNKGIVFSVPVGGGAVTTLATFAGTSNGATPGGSLTLIGSTLYGTTESGGANNDGIVFSVPAAGGTITTLGTFAGTSNGASPNGNLMLIGSTLYGVTGSGGANNNGTVFSLPLAGGAITTLATFASASNGAGPTGNLTLSNDSTTFYGVTVQGGANNKGTVFSVPVAGGAITTLATFAGTSNGATPEDGLILSSDGSTLYGTTQSGGANNDGTVFAVVAPEPGSATLLLAGLLGMAWRRRRPISG